MKSNQKSSHQKCFFAHMAFTLQSGQNHGLLNLTSTSFALYPPLQARFAMPLQPHRPTLFCPLSPEAYLLTGKEREIIKSLIPQSLGSSRVTTNCRPLACEANITTLFSTAAGGRVIIGHSARAERLPGFNLYVIASAAWTTDRRELINALKSN